MRLALEDLNLETARRRIVETALAVGGSIVDAAELLGITRHNVKREIVRLRIEYPFTAERKAELLRAVGDPAPQRRRAVAALGNTIEPPRVGAGDLARETVRVLAPEEAVQEPVVRRRRPPEPPDEAA